MSSDPPIQLSPDRVAQLRAAADRARKIRDWLVIIAVVVILIVVGYNTLVTFQTQSNLGANQKSSIQSRVVTVKQRCHLTWGDWQQAIILRRKGIDPQWLVDYDNHSYRGCLKSLVKIKQLNRATP